MAVDLEDLIPFLKAEVASPGSEETAFADAITATWLVHLQNAFWQARLDGMLKGFVEASGQIEPETTGADDLSRDLQQLVVLYAGIAIVRNQLREINTLFRAKAGPVEYETQKSAQLLKGILDELHSRRGLVLERLSDLGVVEDVYIDALAQRQANFDAGTGTWAGSGA